MKNKIILVFSLFVILSNSGYCQTAKVAGATGGDITKEQLLNVTKIDIDTSFRVYSFSMTYMTSQELDDFKCNGPVFSSEMLEVIKGAKSGAKLFFEDIVATDNKGVHYKLQTMTFKIK
jgi:hypothetical protein